VSWTPYASDAPNGEGRQARARGRRGLVRHGTALILIGLLVAILAATVIQVLLSR
jgi:hypothetical protein